MLPVADEGKAQRGQRSIKSRICVSPMILSDTATGNRWTGHRSNVIKLVSFRPTLSDRRESNGEWTKEISERMRLRFLSAPGENP